MRTRRAPTALAAAIALVAMAGLPNAAVAQGPPPAAEGTERYIVVLERGEVRAAAAVEAHAEEAGLEPTHVYSHALSGYAAELTPDELEALREDDRVAYVAEDTAYELLDQDVPTGVRRTFGDDNPATGIGAATDRRVDADVAIIDSGVNNHRDLHVVDRVDCLVPGGCSPGGFDESGHATHVAGSAAAINDDTGVVGTAPGARVWSQKVCSTVLVSCTTAAIVAAVDYVTARADVIEAVNMSLGGTVENPAITEAITRSVDAGVVYVVAAGNSRVDASTFHPAAHPDVITVSALADSDGEPGGQGGQTTCQQVYPDDTTAGYSNWGTAVEVAAPGTCITSTASNGTGYEVRSGTSMASPHVAGAAAALASTDKPTDDDGVLALRDRLVAAGNLDYTHVGGGATDPQEPLLDMGDPAVFAPDLVAPQAWDAATAVPGGTSQFAEAQCAQDIDGYYKFGGTLTNGTATASSWRYDFATRTWDELAPYPGGAREGLAAACTPDGDVHVIGGTGADHHVYDIGADTWRAAPPLPRDTVHAAVGAWGDRLYVAGGLGNAFGGAVTTTDVFDLATGTWSTGDAMPHAVGRAGVARVGSSLYVVGGWGTGSPATNVATTVRLDMATGDWHAGPAFPSARADAALVATDSALYAIGGFAPGATLDPSERVERLDLTTPGAAWAGYADLPTPLAMGGGACASTGPDAVIASVGGSAINELTPAFRDEHWQRVVIAESCASDNWGAWQAAAAVPGATARVATAQCPGRPASYYAVGGFAHDPTFPAAASDRAWRYDAAGAPGGGTWAELARHPAGARYGDTAVCTPDGKVHVFGGPAGANHHVLDTATGAWSTGPAVPRPLDRAAVGHWQGRTYVVGGIAGPSATTSVWVPSGTGGSWTTGAPLPEPTGAMGYAQAGRYLYVVGGLGTGSPQANEVRTLRLDMQTGTWATGPDLPGGRYDVGLVATDDALYALGGHVDYLESHTPTQAVHRLDLDDWSTGGWEWFESLPTALGFLGGACLPSPDGAVISTVGGAARGFGVVREHWHALAEGEACASTA